MILFEVNDFNKRYSIVLYTQIRIYRPGPKADMPSLSLSISLSLQFIIHFQDQRRV